MTRRRAQAVLRTELPIKASLVSDYEQRVEGAIALLPGAAPHALTQLATIARTYIDGRRMEAQRVPRPDCRKSLEEASTLAVGLRDVIELLPEDRRRILGPMVKSDLLHTWGRPVLSSEIGHALDEIAQADLHRWLPDTPVALEPLLMRLGLMAGELADRLTNLPQDAEWALIELQQYASVLPDDVAEAEYLHRLVDMFGKLSWTAAQLMKSERGPRSDIVQMRAVQALKVEFERVGDPASHNAKSQRLYTGQSTSSFGSFVHRFFADVEPNPKLRRGLDDAIAFACWPSRSSARQENVQQDAEARQSRIIELLTTAGVTNFSPHQDKIPT